MVEHTSYLLFLLGGGSLLLCSPGCDPKGSLPDDSAGVDSAGLDESGETGEGGETAETGETGTEAGCPAQLDDGTVYETIQDAVDAAVSGATIRVCAGSYEAPLVVDKSLSIASREGSAATSLVSPGVGSVVSVGEDVELSLSGFTLSGGVGSANPYDEDSTVGGGVDALLAGPLRVADCIIEGNSASFGAGIIAGQLVLSDSTIRDNLAIESGGALYLSGDSTLSGVVLAGNGAEFGGGIYLSAADLDLDDTLIEENSALYGGGLWAKYELVVAADGTTELRGNEATWGGGLLSYNAEADEQMLGGLVLSGNFATGSGGGLYVYRGAVLLSGAVLTGNGAPDGAGLFVDTAAATLTGVTMEENEATGMGGGAALLDGDLVVLEGSATANRAEAGGFAALIGESRLLARGSDLGSGSTDNVPDDVSVEGSLSWSTAAPECLLCSMGGCEEPGADACELP